MRKQLSLTSTALAGIAVVCSYLGVTGGYAQANDTQQVAIKFSAKVGNKNFNCGTSYSGLGTPAITVTPTDFRYYVFNVSLINAAGKRVPLNLSQDRKWQYQNVALLDFENKSGPCKIGTTAIRNQVVGTVPKGNYKGLQFTLGVPFNLNHQNLLNAPAPLNLTSLWWGWLYGYRFVRIDMNNNTETGFGVHLGSTGCQPSPVPSSCSNENTSRIVFNKFDPNRNVVVADLKPLVTNTNLAVPYGCHSGPSSLPCKNIMANLGLPFGGNASPGQKFFRVE